MMGRCQDLPWPGSAAPPCRRLRRRECCRWPARSACRIARPLRRCEPAGRPGPTSAAAVPRPTAQLGVVRDWDIAWPAPCTGPRRRHGGPSPCSRSVRRRFEGCRLAVGNLPGWARGVQPDCSWQASPLVSSSSRGDDPDLIEKRVVGMNPAYPTQFIKARTSQAIPAGAQVAEADRAETGDGVLVRDGDGPELKDRLPAIWMITAAFCFASMGALRMPSARAVIGC